jgi:anti-sigma factor RsiW
VRSELGTPAHVDEYALLRYVANDLHDLDARRVEIHVRACAACAQILAEIRWLDGKLLEHGPTAFEDEALDEALPPSDPFRERPLPGDGASRHTAFGGTSFLDLVLTAGREA